MSDVVELEIAELEALRAELESRIATAEAPRWNADPEEVQRSVAKLVLTLVDFIRQLLERQAIRRMDADTLTPEAGGGGRPRPPAPRRDRRGDVPSVRARSQGAEPRSGAARQAALKRAPS